MRFDACTLVLVFCLGCSQTVEQRMRLQYIPPQIPVDVPPDYRPSPGSREEEMLEPGEKTINLRDAYLRGHRYGWNLAIDEWSRKGKFTYQSRKELQVGDMPSTVDAMWEGYSEARRQIGSKAK